MKHDGRMARLKIEQEKLINLAKRSDFIEVHPVDVQPGWPPEKYVITFRCKGITGIDAGNNPQSSDFHQVSIYLSRDFPKQEPYLKWLTPIWHPNIEHEEPHHVCTNNVQNWYPSKSLDDLVVVLGEMVQYKRYHAVWAQPWPLDQKAAAWVREYAEPKKIIGPEKPFDERPLLRTYEIRLWGGKGEERKSRRAEKNPQGAAPPRRAGKLTLGVKKMTGELRGAQPAQAAPPAYAPAPEPRVPVPPAPVEPPVVRKKGLTLGAMTQYVTCSACGQTNRIKLVEGVANEFFCGSCEAEITITPREKDEQRAMA